uniref:Uncharacterized protein n=1 Tax=Anguilla anguilla TaxID=7936 RepID=A0A0E9U021_ANGAN
MVKIKLYLNHIRKHCLSIRLTPTNWTGTLDLCRCDPLDA